jgi:hypothetical protein
MNKSVKIVVCFCWVALVVILGIWVELSLGDYPHLQDQSGRVSFAKLIQGDNHPKPVASKE